jgi:hypothetical protein
MMVNPSVARANRSGGTEQSGEALQSNVGSLTSEKLILLIFQILIMASGLLLASEFNDPGRSER